MTNLPRSITYYQTKFLKADILLPKQIIHGTELQKETMKKN